MTDYLPTDDKFLWESILCKSVIFRRIYMTIFSPSHFLHSSWMEHFFSENISAQLRHSPLFQSELKRKLDSCCAIPDEREILNHPLAPVLLLDEAELEKFILLLGGIKLSSAILHIISAREINGIKTILGQKIFQIIQQSAPLIDSDIAQTRYVVTLTENANLISAMKAEGRKILHSLTGETDSVRRRLRMRLPRELTLPLSLTSTAADESFALRAMKQWSPEWIKQFQF